MSLIFFTVRIIKENIAENIITVVEFKRIFEFKIQGVNAIPIEVGIIA